MDGRWNRWWWDGWVMEMVGGGWGWNGRVMGWMYDGTGGWWDGWVMEWVGGGWGWNGRVMGWMDDGTGGWWDGWVMEWVGGGWGWNGRVMGWMDDGTGGWWNGWVVDGDGMGGWWDGWMMEQVGDGMVGWSREALASHCFWTPDFLPPRAPTWFPGPFRVWWRGGKRPLGWYQLGSFGSDANYHPWTPHQSLPCNWFWLIMREVNVKHTLPPQ